jgi:O-antigen ligase
MTARAMRGGDVGPARAGDRALPVLAALASLPVGGALGLALYAAPPPLALALAGGVGLLLVLALALARYDAAVALGGLLLGLQAVDPAPADGVFFVVIAVAFATRRFRLSSVPRPVVAMFAVFGALNVMASIQVVDPERAVVFFGTTAYLALFAIWLAGYTTSRGRALLLVRAYLGSAVASAVIGVLALLGALPGGELLTESDRSRAFFQDPNVFGPFLIPPALILIEEIVRPRLLSARLATKAVLLAILLIGVLFSYSRGAWVNLALALVVLGLILSLRGGARTAATLVAGTAVTAASMAAVVVATGSADFLAERARPQTYDTDRFSGQRAGLSPAAEYPFGAGPGQFESIAHISAHSTYARALGEEGYPGLLTLVALLGFTLIAGLRNAVAGRGTHGIGSAALLAAWCGLLANSAVIDTLHWRHLWLLAALIWAATVTGRRRA